MQNKIFLFIFLISALSLRAQTEYGSYFGFSGGASFNSFQKLGLSPQESISPSFGLHFSGIYGYRFNDYLGFQTGLQYTAKGGILYYKGDSKAVLYSEEHFFVLNGTRTMKRKIEFHAITVPVQLTINPIPKVQIGIGAYGGVGIDATMNGYFIISNAFTESGKPLEQSYRVNLSGTYYTDNRGYGIPQNPNNYVIFTIDGKIVKVLNESNPYHEHGPDTERYIRRFEGGLYGSLEYDLKKGFSIGSALSYQLTPMTNPDGELNYHKVDANGNFLTSDNSKRLWNVTLYLALTF